MSTKMTKLVLALGAMVMTGGALAQSYASANATASATVIKPLALAKTADLNFGTIVSGNAGGVVLFPNGGVGTSGAADIKYSSGATPAQFTASGEAGMAFNLTLPRGGPGEDVTLSNGANGEMVVTAFASSIATSGATLGSDGTTLFKVGATLNVAANQAVGAYTGAFSVSVDYN